MPAVADALLLPPGTRLLHIGPHKTGTSSLQAAFHHARRGAAAHGVQYAGRSRQAAHAAQAIVRTGQPEMRREALRPWRALLREVRASTAARVVISSEYFCDAGDDAARRIVDALDPARLHVVVTLRSLAAVMPSQWQQHLQAGMTVGYESWLEAVLNGSGPLAERFWHRHRHDALVARWVAAAGREQVSVVVADERDRGAVLRAFEQLVGLPDGFLVPDDDQSNRSLTKAESELVRATNAALAETFTNDDLHELVFAGAAAHLKSRLPGPEEPRIETPAWANRPISAIAREIVDGIRASGVRVIGDLDELLGDGRVTRAARMRDAVSGPGVGERPWPELAARATLGIVLASGMGSAGRARGGDVWPDPAAEGSVVSLRPGASFSNASARLQGFATSRLRSAFVERVRRSTSAGRLARRRAGRSQRGMPVKAAMPRDAE